MTKSVKLKALAVQAKLRAAQDAALRAELADEAFDAHNKAANRRFTPLFTDIEYERGVERAHLTGDVEARAPTPLAWQLDNVMASASEAAQRFRRASAARARDLAEKVAAIEDRPLMMLSAAEDAAADRARVDALVKLSKDAAKHADYVAELRKRAGRAPLGGSGRAPGAENGGADDAAATEAAISIGGGA